MSKPTVLGYMHEQPERLAYVFENRDVFVKPFVEVFQKNNIKKVIFFGSGTSYNVSWLPIILNTLQTLQQKHSIQQCLSTMKNLIGLAA